jgi:hypothetical protein
MRILRETMKKWSQNRGMIGSLEYCQFLLIVIKSLRSKKFDNKAIILMSKTIDTKLKNSYSWVVSFFILWQFAKSYAGTSVTALILKDYSSLLPTVAFSASILLPYAYNERIILILTLYQIHRIDLTT